MSQTELQIIPANVKNMCVQCSFDIDHLKSTFEQRLIEDEDFCARCWAEMMSTDEDEVDIELPVIR